MNQAGSPPSSPFRTLQTTRRMSIPFPSWRDASTRSYWLQSPPQKVRRRPRASIHILDDDSLLNMFSLCRPSIFANNGSGGIVWGGWGHERWWYKLVHICKRWRYLVLGSASHLGLCLVCAPGTPVAYMLAHSPPFPLIINHDNPNHDLTTEDEEGIMVALKHRDRVERICLKLPVSKLRKLVTVLNDEFPALQFLRIGPPTKHDTRLALPLTFEAPQLRCLWLTHFVSPIGSRLLITALGLVTLTLQWIHPSTYPHPNDFLQQLSPLPQLEELNISFRSPVPNRNIERQLLHTPVTAHATHPNLRSFVFVGVSAYLEALLPHTTAPLLEKLSVQFFNRLSFSVPNLPHFMITTEMLRFSSARFFFHHEAVSMLAYPRVGSQLSNFNVTVPCEHFDWRVSSVAQICLDLSPLFSEVADLTIDYREHTFSSEWHNKVNRARWHELLRSFRNVQTLRVHKDLIGDLCRSLPREGEPTLELLPELQELVCPARSHDYKAFDTFIHDREAVGRPVNLIKDTFPVGHGRYAFVSSTGISIIEPDPEPLDPEPLP